MADSPFVSLFELGQLFADPSLPTPHRKTLMRRGHKIATQHGIDIVTVDRHSFIRRADLDRLADPLERAS